jgi:hypothetical protein
VKDGVLRQSCLFVTSAALEYFDVTSEVAGMSLVTALMADKTTGPLCSLDSSCTLFFGAIISKKVVQANAWLKLYAIHLHGRPPQEEMCREYNPYL